MIVNLYNILDTASGVYDGPHKARAHPEMMRQFERLCVQDGSMIKDHPEHFSLWFVGTFDDNTGQVVHEDHVCICKAIDFRKGDLAAVGEA